MKESMRQRTGKNREQFPPVLLGVCVSSLSGIMFQQLSLCLSKLPHRKNFQARCEELTKWLSISLILIYFSQIFLQDHFFNKPIKSQQTINSKK